MMTHMVNRLVQGVFSVHCNEREQRSMQDYYDAAGNRYEYHSWTSGVASDRGVAAPEGYSYKSFPLNDYPYDEVWLTPRYTGRWSADVPVEVSIALK